MPGIYTDPKLKVQNCEILHRKCRTISFQALKIFFLKIHKKGGKGLTKQAKNEHTEETPSSLKSLMGSH